MHSPDGVHRGVLAQVGQTKKRPRGDDLELAFMVRAPLRPCALARLLPCVLLCAALV